MAFQSGTRFVGRSIRLAAAIATSITLASASAVYARGPLPRPPVDCGPPRCDVADRIAAACPCDAATSHRSHVQCVTRAARELVLGKALPRACKRAVVRCAARSTCGNPALAACRVPVGGGGERCQITRSAARCETTGGAVASGSCCRACPTTTTSTTETTSTTSSTTTTSTTTSTTTTLLPCAGIYPVCIASCPAGLQCTADSLLAICVCTPIP